MTWVLSAIPPEQAALSEAVLFYVLAVMAVASSVWVMVSRNIVRTAVGLLAALLAVGGLYFLLHAEFLAAVQLVVYAGGTLILIVFGVMLTNKSPYTQLEANRNEVMVALSVGGVLLTAMVIAMLNWAPVAAPGPGGLSGPEGYPMLGLGQALLGDYLVPFEVVSVLLLVVMIGAAYLAKAVRTDKPADTGKDLSRRAREWS